MIRPLITPLAQDAIAEWLRRATGLPIVIGDASEPRESRPYVSFTFPRGRPATGDRTLRELISTIGATTITITAGEEERAAARLGPAIVELTREVGEPIAEFAARWAAEAGWWLRGRATAEAALDVVTVTPSEAGALIAAEGLEGLTLLSVDGGPARRIERLYQATCRITIFASAADAPGATGDGFDTYSIEAAIREALSDEGVKRVLRGGWLVPTGTPRESPSYASAISGPRRESRASFDVTLGWTGAYPAASEPIVTIEYVTEGAALHGEDPMNETSEITP